MTLSDLVTRFPEIPADLHQEPILESFANTFGTYLPTAAKPSACSTDRTPENHVYMTLVAPIDIYRYGLASKEKVLGQLLEMISAYETSSDAFVEKMFAGS